MAITPVNDTEISLHAAMDPLQVHAQAIFGDLRFSATGLPQGITIDSSNNLYVADTSNNAIRKVTSGAVVTTLAGQTTAVVYSFVGVRAKPH